MSALMSGGMIKIGIFGILKVGLDLLSASGVQVWWGLMVMVFGAISSVLGVAFALQEHDIKRLLAYHSVENIGIILLGVGASMAAMALNSVGIAVLALMAALYHTFNHAMFKGELFLGRGCAAVLHGYAQYGEDGRPVPSYAGNGHLLPRWRAWPSRPSRPSTALCPSGLPTSRSLTPPCRATRPS